MITKIEIPNINLATQLTKFKRLKISTKNKTITQHTHTVKQIRYSKP